MYEVYVDVLAPQRHLLVIEAESEEHAAEVVAEIFDEEESTGFHIVGIQESSFMPSEVESEDVKDPNVLTVIDTETGEEKEYSITHNAPSKIQ